MKTLEDKFIMCCNCNYGFSDRDEFNTHSCVDMMKPAHHLDCLVDKKGEWLKEPKCIDDCPLKMSAN